MTLLRAVRTIAPEVQALTIEEVRQHLHIDDVPDENDYLNSLIATATDYIEGIDGIIGKALITQTWKVNAGAWPDCRFRLPLSPVQSIASVMYYDGDGVQQSFSSDYWLLYRDDASAYVDWITGASFPSLYSRDDAVEVTFVAGYGDTAESVPAAIKHAMKLLIGQWYENREATGEAAPDISFGVTHLLAPKRAIYV